MSSVDDVDVEEPSFAALYDWVVTEPSIAVVEAVAADANRHVVTLPPLYESVDPDALDAVVGTADGPTARRSVVRFTYADRTVTVGSDGLVEVRPAE